MMKRPSPPSSGAAPRRRIVMVCGTKYGFRSYYVPILRSLSRFGKILVYLLDFPENYDIRPVLQDLASSGVIGAYSIIPNNRHWLRYHRALGKICQSLRRDGLDLLIMDADFMEMHQYLIAVARSKNAIVVALQSGVPKQLLVSYEAALSGKRDFGRSATEGHFNTRRMRRLVSRLIYGPNRLSVIAGGLRHYKFLWRTSFESMVNYRLFPILFLGRSLSFHDYEQSGSILFASTRVDAAIVYTERLKEALLYFFPQMKVLVAEHPLAANCRCSGQELKSKLLVALTGPWRNYIEPDNPAEVIEMRWCEAISNAVALKGFSEVHIRPHPREKGRYPYSLAEKLSARGIVARVVDARESTLSDTICDYAGTLGAPSGALLEAAVSCRRVFVIGLEGIQGNRVAPSFQAYSADVVSVPKGCELAEEHFLRTQESGLAKRSVCDIVADLLNNSFTSIGHPALGC